MSGESNRNEDFDEQLRLQQLYGQKREDGDDPYTYTDPDDGTVYDWDQEKKAWFPQITEDFMAAYQASYGFTEDGAAAPSTESEPEKPNEETTTTTETTTEEDSGNTKEEKKKGEKRKPEPGWFDIELDKNTNVYVSGLPPDISPEEFVDVMSKCGIIMRDPLTEEYKIKLYKDAQGNQKGDGLCCYLKRESVALAERLLDDYEIRGYRLHVEAARFELKGQYDASKKKKKNKEYRKKLQQQQKQLDWRPEKKGEVRKRHERVVIIQNMFHPSDFEEDPLELNEYREDLRIECEKFGEVKKVMIYDRHPEGVASVAFKEPEEADKCVATLNGRWFGGRQLSAQLWDGVTDYQVDETMKEREERLKGWSSFLGDAKNNETKSTEEQETKKANQTEEKQTQQKTDNRENRVGTKEEPQEEKKTEEETEEEEMEEKKKTEEKMEAEVKSTDSSLAGSDEEL